jgi:hypothetical protein
MLYGSEYWVVYRRTEQSINLVEMIMLRWMSGVKREDIIRGNFIYFIIPCNLRLDQNKIDISW